MGQDQSSLAHGGSHLSGKYGSIFGGNSKDVQSMMGGVFALSTIMGGGHPSNMLLGGFCGSSMDGLSIGGNRALTGGVTDRSNKHSNDEYDSDSHDDKMMKFFIKLGNYKHNMSNTLRTELVARIADIMSKAGVKGISRDSSPIEIMNTLKQQLPNPLKGTTITSSNAVTEKLIKGLVELVNTTFGSSRELIDTKLPLSRQISELSDWIMSISMGFQYEFKFVHEQLQTVMSNLKLVEDMSSELVTREMNKLTGENISSQAKAELMKTIALYEGIQRETQRQINMLDNILHTSSDNITSVTTTTSNATEAYNRITDLSRLNNSASFGDRLAYILTLMGDLTYIATITNEALTATGIKLDEYKKVSNHQELNKLIESKMKSGVAKTPEDILKFYSNIGVLLKFFSPEVANKITELNQHLRKGVTSKGNNLSSQSSSQSSNQSSSNSDGYIGGYSGGKFDTSYTRDTLDLAGIDLASSANRPTRVSEIDRKIEEQRKGKIAILKNYINAMSVAINKFIKALDGTVEVLKDMTIHNLTHLVEFKRFIEYLKDIKTRYKFLAIVGYYEEPTASNEYQRYRSYLDKAIQLANNIAGMGGEYSPLSESYKKLASSLSEIKSTIELYTEGVKLVFEILPNHELDKVLPRALPATVTMADTIKRFQYFLYIMNMKSSIAKTTKETEEYGGKYVDLLATAIGVKRRLIEEEIKEGYLKLQQKMDEVGGGNGKIGDSFIEDIQNYFRCRGIELQFESDIKRVISNHSEEYPVEFKNILDEKIYQNAVVNSGSYDSSYASPPSGTYTPGAPGTSGPIPPPGPSGVVNRELIDFNKLFEFSDRGDPQWHTSKLVGINTGVFGYMYNTNPQDSDITFGELNAGGNIDSNTITDKIVLYDAGAHGIKDIVLPPEPMGASNLYLLKVNDLSGVSPTVRNAFANLAALPEQYVCRFINLTDPPDNVPILYFPFKVHHDVFGFNTKGSAMLIASNYGVVRKLYLIDTDVASANTIAMLNAIINPAGALALVIDATTVNRQKHFIHYDDTSGIVNIITTFGLYIYNSVAEYTAGQPKTNAASYTNHAKYIIQISIDITDYFVGTNISAAAFNALVIGLPGINGVFIPDAEKALYHTYTTPITGGSHRNSYYGSSHRNSYYGSSHRDNYYSGGALTYAPMDQLNTFQSIGSLNFKAMLDKDLKKIEAIDEYKEHIKAEFKAKMRFYKALEALEHTLKNMTLDNADILATIKHITDVLNDTKIHTGWSTDATGDLLVNVFESMPCGIQSTSTVSASSTMNASDAASSTMTFTNTPDTPHPPGITGGYTRGGAGREGNRSLYLEVSKSANDTNYPDIHYHNTIRNISNTACMFDYTFGNALGTVLYSNIYVKPGKSSEHYYVSLLKAIQDTRKKLKAYLDNGAEGGAPIVAPHHRPFETNPLIEVQSSTYGKASGVLESHRRSKTMESIDLYYDNFQALKNIFYIFTTVSSSRKTERTTFLTPNQIYLAFTHYLKQSALTRKPTFNGIAGRTTMYTKYTGLILPAYYGKCNYSPYYDTRQMGVDLISTKGTKHGHLRRYQTDDALGVLGDVKPSNHLYERRYNRAIKDADSVGEYVPNTEYVSSMRLALPRSWSPLSSNDITSVAYAKYAPSDTSIQLQPRTISYNYTTASAPTSRSEYSIPTSDLRTKLTPSTRGLTGGVTIPDKHYGSDYGSHYGSHHSSHYGSHYDKSYDEYYVVDNYRDAAGLLTHEVLPRMHITHETQLHTEYRSPYEVEDKFFVHAMKAIVGRVLTVLGLSYSMDNNTSTKSIYDIRSIVGGQGLVLGGGHHQRNSGDRGDRGDTRSLRTLLEMRGGIMPEAIPHDGGSYIPLEVSSPPEVIDEATPLYFYLPRYVEFYKHLFNNTPDELSGDDDKELISTLQDFSSVYQNLIKYIFRSTGSMEYTEAEVNVIIREINKIYAHYSGSKSPVQDAIRGLVNEINRRYSLIKIRHLRMINYSDMNDPRFNVNRDREDIGDAYGNEVTTEGLSLPNRGRKSLPYAEGYDDEEIEAIDLINAPSDTVNRIPTLASSVNNVKKDYLDITDRHMDGVRSKDDFELLKVMTTFRNKVDRAFMDFIACSDDEIPDVPVEFTNLTNQYRDRIASKKDNMSKIPLVSALVKMSNASSVEKESMMYLMFEDTVVNAIKVLQNVVIMLDEVYYRAYAWTVGGMYDMIVSSCEDPNEFSNISTLQGGVRGDDGGNGLYIIVQKVLDKMSGILSYISGNVHVSRLGMKYMGESNSFAKVIGLFRDISEVECARFISENSNVIKEYQKALRSGNAEGSATNLVLHIIDIAYDNIEWGSIIVYFFQLLHSLKNYNEDLITVKIDGQSRDIVLDATGMSRYVRDVINITKHYIDMFRPKLSQEYLRKYDDVIKGVIETPNNRSFEDMFNINYLEAILNEYFMYSVNYSGDRPVKDLARFNKLSEIVRYTFKRRLFGKVSPGLIVNTAGSVSVEKNLVSSPLLAEMFYDTRTYHKLPMTPISKDTLFSIVSNKPDSIDAEAVKGKVLLNLGARKGNMFADINYGIRMIIDQFFDMSVLKIYEPLLRNLVTGKLALSVKDPYKYAYPDIFNENIEALNDVNLTTMYSLPLPSENSMLTFSNAVLLRTILNSVNIRTQAPVHIVQSLADVSNNMKDVFKAKIPVFVKYFDTIYKKVLYYRHIVDNFLNDPDVFYNVMPLAAYYTHLQYSDTCKPVAYGINISEARRIMNDVVSGPSMAQSADISEAYIGKMLEVINMEPSLSVNINSIFNTNVQLVNDSFEMDYSLKSYYDVYGNINSSGKRDPDIKIYILRLLDSYKDVCYGIIGALQSVYNDLDDVPTYMQLHPGFDAEYERSSGKKPTALISYSTIFLEPEYIIEMNSISQPSGNTIGKLQNAFKCIYYLDSVGFKEPLVSGLYATLSSYNSMVNESYKMDKSSYTELLKKLFVLLNYLNTYKGFVNPSCAVFTAIKNSRIPFLKTLSYSKIKADRTIGGGTYHGGAPFDNNKKPQSNVSTASYAMMTPMVTPHENMIKFQPTSYISDKGVYMLSLASSDPYSFLTRRSINTDNDSRNTMFITSMKSDLEKLSEVFSISNVFSSILSIPSFGSEYSESQRLYSTRYVPTTIHTTNLAVVVSTVTGIMFYGTAMYAGLVLDQHTLNVDKIISNIQELERNVTNNSSERSDMLKTLMTAPGANPFDAYANAVDTYGMYNIIPPFADNNLVVRHPIHIPIYKITSLVDNLINIYSVSKEKLVEYKDKDMAESMHIKSIDPSTGVVAATLPYDMTRLMKFLLEPNKMSISSYNSVAIGRTSGELYPALARSIFLSALMVGNLRNNVGDVIQYFIHPYNKYQPLSYDIGSSGIDTYSTSGDVIYYENFHRINPDGNVHLAVYSDQVTKDNSVYGNDMTLRPLNTAYKPDMTTGGGRRDLYGSRDVADISNIISDPRTFYEPLVATNLYIASRGNQVSSKYYNELDKRKTMNRQYDVIHENSINTHPDTTTREENDVARVCNDFALHAKSLHTNSHGKQITSDIKNTYNMMVCDILYHMHKAIMSNPKSYVGNINTITRSLGRISLPYVVITSNAYIDTHGGVNRNSYDIAGFHVGDIVQTYDNTEALLKYSIECIVKGKDPDTTEVDPQVYDIAAKDYIIWAIINIMEYIRDNISTTYQDDKVHPNEMSWIREIFRKALDQDVKSGPLVTANKIPIMTPNTTIAYRLIYIYYLEKYPSDTADQIKGRVRNVEDDMVGLMKRLLRSKGYTATYTQSLSDSSTVYSMKSPTDDKAVIDKISHISSTKLNVANSRKILAYWKTLVTVNKGKLEDLIFKLYVLQSAGTFTGEPNPHTISNDTPSATDYASSIYSIAVGLLNNMMIIPLHRNVMGAYCSLLKYIINILETIFSLSLNLQELTDKYFVIASSVNKSKDGATAPGELEGSIQIVGTCKELTSKLNQSFNTLMALQLAIERLIFVNRDTDDNLEVTPDTLFFNGPLYSSNLYYTTVTYKSEVYPPFMRGRYMEKFEVDTSSGEYVSKPTSNVFQRGVTKNDVFHPQEYDMLLTTDNKRSPSVRFDVNHVNIAVEHENITSIQNVSNIKITSSPTYYDGPHEPYHRLSASKLEDIYGGLCGNPDTNVRKYDGSIKSLLDISRDAMNKLPLPMDIRERVVLPVTGEVNICPYILYFGNFTLCNPETVYPCKDLKELYTYGKRQLINTIARIDSHGTTGSVVDEWNKYHDKFMRFSNVGGTDTDARTFYMNDNTNTSLTSLHAHLCCLPADQITYDTSFSRIMRHLSLPDDKSYNDSVVHEAIRSAVYTILRDTTIFSTFDDNTVRSLDSYMFLKNVINTTKLTNPFIELYQGISSIAVDITEYVKINKQRTEAWYNNITTDRDATFIWPNFPFCLQQITGAGLLGGKTSSVFNRVLDNVVTIVQNSQLAAKAAKTYGGGYNGGGKFSNTIGHKRLLDGKTTSFTLCQDLVKNMNSQPVTKDGKWNMKNKEVAVLVKSLINTYNNYRLDLHRSPITGENYKYELDDSNNLVIAGGAFDIASVRLNLIIRNAYDYTSVVDVLYLAAAVGAARDAVLDAHYGAVHSTPILMYYDNKIAPITITPLTGAGIYDCTVIHNAILTTTEECIAYNIMGRLITIINSCLVAFKMAHDIYDVVMARHAAAALDARKLEQSILANLIASYTNRHVMNGKFSNEIVIDILKVAKYINRAIFDPAIRLFEAPHAPATDLLHSHVFMQFINMVIAERINIYNFSTARLCAPQGAAGAFNIAVRNLNRLAFNIMRGAGFAGSMFEYVANRLHANFMIDDRRMLTSATYPYEDVISDISIFEDTNIYSLPYIVAAKTRAMIIKISISINPPAPGPAPTPKTEIPGHDSQTCQTVDLGTNFTDLNQMISIKSVANDDVTNVDAVVATYIGNIRGIIGVYIDDIDSGISAVLRANITNIKVSIIMDKRIDTTLTQYLGNITSKVAIVDGDNTMLANINNFYRIYNGAIHTISIHTKILTTAMNTNFPYSLMLINVRMLNDTLNKCISDLIALPRIPSSDIRVYLGKILSIIDRIESDKDSTTSAEIRTTRSYILDVLRCELSKVCQMNLRSVATLFYGNDNTRFEVEPVESIISFIRHIKNVFNNMYMASMKTFYKLLYATLSGIAAPTPYPSFNYTRDVSTPALIITYTRQVHASSDLYRMFPYLYSYYIAADRIVTLNIIFNRLMTIGQILNAGADGASNNRSVTFNSRCTYFVIITAIMKYLTENFTTGENLSNVMEDIDDVQMIDIQSRVTATIELMGDLTNANNPMVPGLFQSVMTLIGANTNDMFDYMDHRVGNANNSNMINKAINSRQADTIYNHAFKCIELPTEGVDSNIFTDYIDPRYKILLLVAIIRRLYTWVSTRDLDHTTANARLLCDTFGVAVLPGAAIGVAYGVGAGFTIPPMIESIGDYIEHSVITPVLLFNSLINMNYTQPTILLFDVIRASVLGTVVDDALINENHLLHPINADELLPVETAGFEITVLGQRLIESVRGRPAIPANAGVAAAPPVAVVLTDNIAKPGGAGYTPLPGAVTAIADVETRYIITALIHQYEYIDAAIVADTTPPVVRPHDANVTPAVQARIANNRATLAGGAYDQQIIDDYIVIYEASRAAAAGGGTIRYLNANHRPIFIRTHFVAPLKEHLRNIISMTRNMMFSMINIANIPMLNTEHPCYLLTKSINTFAVNLMEYIEYCETIRGTLAIPLLAHGPRTSKEFVLRKKIINDVKLIFKLSHEIFGNDLDPRNPAYSTNVTAKLAAAKGTKGVNLPGLINPMFIDIMNFLNHPVTNITMDAAGALVDNPIAARKQIDWLTCLGGGPTPGGGGAVKYLNAPVAGDLNDHKTMINSMIDDYKDIYDRYYGNKSTIKTAMKARGMHAMIGGSRGNMRGGSNQIATQDIEDMHIIASAVKGFYRSCTTNRLRFYKLIGEIVDRYSDNDYDLEDIVIEINDIDGEPGKSAGGPLNAAAHVAIANAAANYGSIPSVPMHNINNIPAGLLDASRQNLPPLFARYQGRIGARVPYRRIPGYQQPTDIGWADANVNVEGYFPIHDGTIVANPANAMNYSGIYYHRPKDNPLTDKTELKLANGITPATFNDIITRYEQEVRMLKLDNIEKDTFGVNKVSSTPLIRGGDMSFRGGAPGYIDPITGSTSTPIVDDATILPITRIKSPGEVSAMLTFADEQAKQIDIGQGDIYRQLSILLKNEESRVARLTIESNIVSLNPRYYQRIAEFLTYSINLFPIPNVRKILPPEYLKNITFESTTSLDEANVNILSQLMLDFIQSVEKNDIPLVIQGITRRISRGINRRTSGITYFPYLIRAADLPTSDTVNSRLPVRNDIPYLQAYTFYLSDMYSNIAKSEVSVNIGIRTINTRTISKGLLNGSGIADIAPRIKEGSMLHVYTTNDNARSYLRDTLHATIMDNEQNIYTSLKYIDVSTSITDIVRRITSEVVGNLPYITNMLTSYQDIMTGFNVGLTYHELMEPGSKASEVLLRGIRPDKSFIGSTSDDNGVITESDQQKDYITLNAIISLNALPNANPNHVELTTNRKVLNPMIPYNVPENYDDAKNTVVATLDNTNAGLVLAPVAPVAVAAIAGYVAPAGAILAQLTDPTVQYPNNWNALTPAEVAAPPPDMVVFMYFLTAAKDRNQYYLAANVANININNINIKIRPSLYSILPSIMDVENINTLSTILNLFSSHTADASNVNVICNDVATIIRSLIIAYSAVATSLPTNFVKYYKQLTNTIHSLYQLLNVCVYYMNSLVDQIITPALVDPLSLSAAWVVGFGAAVTADNALFDNLSIIVVTAAQLGAARAADPGAAPSRLPDINDNSEVLMKKYCNMFVRCLLSLVAHAEVTGFVTEYRRANKPIIISIYSRYLNNHIAGPIAGLVAAIGPAILQNDLKSFLEGSIPTAMIPARLWSDTMEMVSIYHMLRYYRLSEAHKRENTIGILNLLSRYINTGRLIAANLHAVIARITNDSRGLTGGMYSNSKYRLSGGYNTGNYLSGGNNTSNYLSGGDDSLYIEFDPELVYELITSHNPMEKLKQMVDSKVTENRRDTPKTNQKLRTIVKSILEFNIYPVNVHAMQRFMPFANIYNYSYTFDRYVENFLGLDMGELDGYTPSYTDIIEASSTKINNKYNMDNTICNKAFAVLLVNPLVPIDTLYFGSPMHGVLVAVSPLGRIFRGTDELGIGRAKFMSDQLLNKVYFGSVITGSDLVDHTFKYNVRGDSRRSSYRLQESSSSEDSSEDDLHRGYSGGNSNYSGGTRRSKYGNKRSSKYVPYANKFNNVGIDNPRKVFATVDLDSAAFDTESLAIFRTLYYFDSNKRDMNVISLQYDLVGADVDPYYPESRGIAMPSFSTVITTQDTEWSSNMSNREILALHKEGYERFNTQISRMSLFISSLQRFLRLRISQMFLKPSKQIEGYTKGMSRELTETNIYDSPFMRDLSRRLL